MAQSSYYNMQYTFSAVFGSRDEIFSKSRDDSSLAHFYASHISEELLVHSGENLSAHIGVLILEPGKTDFLYYSILYNSFSFNE